MGIKTKDSPLILKKVPAFRRPVFQTCAISALITFLIVLFTYVVLGFAPFSDKALIYKDGQHQLCDLLCWFKDVLNGQSSISYSFSKYLGGSNFAVFSYYMASPLNLLMLFFPKSEAPLFMNILFLLKASLAALFAAYYINRRFHPDNKTKYGITIMLIRENEDPSAARYTIKSTLDTFEADTVILACGIQADTVHGLVAVPDFKIVPTRGEYFLLDKSEGSRVDHVIFQCPNEKGKGVLVAPTVHGNLICGPTSEVLEDDIEDTATTSSKLSEIKEKAAKSVCNISWRDNVRNFSGIRANSTADDFIIREIPGKKGIFEAAGIKSPGLASSPAIGPYVVDLLKNSGVKLIEKEKTVGPSEEQQGYDLTRSKVHFRDLDNEERAVLVKKDPAYGRIVCRCEGVTEGEIRDAIDSPIPPCSLDAVKRRAGTGMGRCQGGFCGPRIVEMEPARSLYSTLPSAALRPTVIRTGIPMRSASLNLTPARSSLSSIRTSAPAFSSASWISSASTDACTVS